MGLKPYGLVILHHTAFLHPKVVRRGELQLELAVGNHTVSTGRLDRFADLGPWAAERLMVNSLRRESMGLCRMLDFLAQQP